MRNIQREWDYMMFLCFPKPQSTLSVSPAMLPIKIPLDILGEYPSSNAVSGFFLFSPGRVFDYNIFSLYSEPLGIPVDVQHKIMSRWPDGSAKCVHVVAVADADLLKSGDLYLIVDKQRKDSTITRSQEVPSVFHRQTFIKNIRVNMGVEGKRFTQTTSNIDRNKWEKGPVRWQTYDHRRSKYIEALFLQKYFADLPQKTIQLTAKYTYPQEKDVVDFDFLEWQISFDKTLNNWRVVDPDRGIFSVFFDGEEVYVYLPWFSEIFRWIHIGVQGNVLSIRFSPNKDGPMYIHLGSGNTINVHLFAVDKNKGENVLSKLISPDEYVSLVPKDVEAEGLWYYYSPENIPESSLRKLEEIIGFYRNHFRIAPTDYNHPRLDSEPPPAVHSLFFRRGALANRGGESLYTRGGDKLSRDYRQGDLSYYLLLYYYHCKDILAKEVALDYARYVCDNGIMSHNKGYWNGSMRYYTAHDYSESVYNRFSGILAAYYTTNSYYFYLMSKRVADAGYFRLTANGELLSVDQSGAVSDITLSRTPYLAYDYILAFQTFGDARYLYTAEKLMDFLRYSQNPGIPYWYMSWNWRQKQWAPVSSRNNPGDSFRNFYAYAFSGIYLALMEYDGGLPEKNIPYLEQMLRVEHRYFPEHIMYDPRWGLMYLLYSHGMGDEEYFQATKDALEEFEKDVWPVLSNQRMKENLLFIPLTYRSMSDFN